MTDLHTTGPTASPRPVKRDTTVFMRSQLRRCTPEGGDETIDLTEAEHVEHSIYRNGNLHYLNRDEIISNAKSGLIDGPRIHFADAGDTWSDEIEIHWPNGEVEMMAGTIRVFDPDDLVTGHGLSRVDRKAKRLLLEGCVTPIEGALGWFSVAGDSGLHVVATARDAAAATGWLAFCDCPAHGRCSHIEACIAYQQLPAEGQRMVDTLAAGRQA
jgi:hypothetical protein